MKCNGKRLKFIINCGQGLQLPYCPFTLSIAPCIFECISAYIAISYSSNGRSCWASITRSFNCLVRIFSVLSMKFFTMTELSGRSLELLWSEPEVCYFVLEARWSPELYCSWGEVLLCTCDALPLGCWLLRSEACCDYPSLFSCNLTSRFR